MTLQLKGRITKPEAVLVRQLGEESVLLNLESESYFGLDDVGTRMWDALTNTSSLEAAFEKLLDEYEVDPERLRSDLAVFVQKLAGAGLIDVSDDV